MNKRIILYLFFINSLMLLNSCNDSIVETENREILLKIKILGSYGFCPIDGDLLSGRIERKQITRSTEKIILTGSALFYGILSDSSDCFIRTNRCINKRELGEITLTDTEITVLNYLLNSIPKEIHSPQYPACDPCLRIEYRFQNRIEKIDPCQTQTALYRENMDSLRIFLINVVLRSMEK